MFINKPASLKLIFEKLHPEITSWKGVSASATKSCIVFIAAKTFLVVKVMKNELDLKFALPEKCEDFPIYKQAAHEKKVEHYIRLIDKEDLDGDVFRLLRVAYEMVKG